MLHGHSHRYNLNYLNSLVNHKTWRSSVDIAWKYLRDRENPRDREKNFWTLQAETLRQETSRTPLFYLINQINKLHILRAGIHG